MHYTIQYDRLHAAVTSGGDAVWRSAIHRPLNQNTAAHPVRPVISVVDDYTARIAWIQPDTHELVVLSTGDAGAHWRTNRQAVDPSVIALSDMTFYSASRGWAIALSPGGSEQSGKSLLSTDDGGQSWTPINSTDGSLPMAGGQPRVVFASFDRGYLINPNGIDLDDALRRTTDGGHHWHKAGLPDPLPQAMAQHVPIAISESACLADDKTACPVLVAMLGSNQRAAPWVLLRPRCAQQAWQSYQAVGLPETSGSGTYGDTARFITPTIGFLFDNGQLYRTGDAGRHSGAVEMPSALGRGPTSYTLQFQSKRRGQLYVAEDGGAPVLRFKTNDAGRHWHMEP